MFLVYGFYILLFILCTRILVQRRKDNNRAILSRLYLWTTILLFMIGTFMVILTTFSTARQAVVFFRSVETGNDGDLTNLETVDIYNNIVDSALRSGLFCIFTNVLADVLLIHRCYLIWNSSKLLLIILGSLAFATNTIGIVGVIMMICSGDNYKLYVKSANIKLAHNGAAAGVNLLITLLTAAQVWWTTREARALLGGHINRFYHSTVAIILESGIMYPLSLVANGALVATHSKAVLAVDLQPIVVLLAGITPALIIVRAHWARKCSGEQISDIQFGNLSETYTANPK